MNNKVTFLDEHLENVHFEHSALRRKLQSKVEALTIMSTELDKCRAERDQFKLMAEQIQYRLSVLKKMSFPESSGNFSGAVDYNQQGGTSVKLLNDLREHNKALIIEVHSLSQNLQDCQGDLKVLRKQLISQKVEVIPADVTDVQNFCQERDDFVQQMESLNMKMKQLKSDMRAILDEKEELITERDAYKCKVHRLNHELNVVLKGDKLQTQILDIDSLIMENKYVTDRLQQSEAEKELANQALLKYKSLLESKRKKGAIKLGSNSTDLIMTHKQVKQLLEKGSFTELPVTGATISDLKSLCLGMLDALNDKSLALSHQRKANRILASRISELEQKLESLGGENAKISMFPSQILLEDYNNAEVDKTELNLEPELKTDRNEDVSDVNIIQKSDDEENCPATSQTNAKFTPNHVEIHECFQGNYTRDADQNKKLDSSRSNIGQNNVEELSDLPPNLEMLVQEALEDIKRDRLE